MFVNSRLHAVVLFAALLSTILLAACSSGNSSAPTRQLYSGSDGIIMSFPQTNALRQYEGDLFTVSVRLLNDGTADLTRTAPGIITAAYDTSVVKALEVRTSSSQFTSTATDAATSVSTASSSGSTASLLDRSFDIVNQLRTGTLGAVLPSAQASSPTGYARAPFTARGRSRDAPIGDVAFVEFTFEGQKLAQNRQVATTPLTVQACYPYTTTFIGEICVDRDLLNGGSGGGCSAAAISAQPQGAPIAVRSITPRYTRVNGGVQARYEITLENIRDGLVLWPGKDADSVAVCDLSELNRDHYGKAMVTAQITGTPLRCGTDDANPGLVRFDKRQATIICRLDQADLPAGFQSGSNYQAPIIIQTHYFYIQTLTAQLEVVQ